MVDLLWCVFCLGQQNFTLLQSTFPILAKVLYQVGTGSMYAGSYAIVQVDNYPSPIQSVETDFVIGQRVQLLSSTHLGMAMVFADTINLPAVVANFNARWGVFLVIEGLLLLVGLSIGIPFRLYQFCQHLWQKIRFTWQNSMADKSNTLDRLVALTDFSSQVITLLIATILVYLVVLLLVQAVLLVENSGLVATTVVLIVAGILIFLPFAERLVDLILAIKNQAIWRKVLLITRNGLTTAFGITLIVKLLQFPSQVNIRQLDTIQDVLLAFISYLFG